MFTRDRGKPLAELSVIARGLVRAPKDRLGAALTRGLGEVVSVAPGCSQASPRPFRLSTYCWYFVGPSHLAVGETHCFPWQQDQLVLVRGWHGSDGHSHDFPKPPPHDSERPSWWKVGKGKKGFWRRWGGAGSRSHKPVLIPPLKQKNECPFLHLLFPAARAKGDQDPCSTLSHVNCPRQGETRGIALWQRLFSFKKLDLHNFILYLPKDRSLQRLYQNFAAIILLRDRAPVLQSSKQGYL